MSALLPVALEALGIDFGMIGRRAAARTSGSGIYMNEVRWRCTWMGGAYQDQSCVERRQGLLQSLDVAESPGPCSVMALLSVGAPLTLH